MLQPIHAFLSAESAGGLVLMISAVLALIWANSPWAASYAAFWHTKVGVGSDSIGLKMSLEHWISDGLMAVFFLLVGLEIKRELLLGELATLSRAAIPAAAALGGMVVPAGIFLALNFSGDRSHGWGIPMATDIAFAVGVLTLVGRAVPMSVRVFLLAIAIVDDLGAVLVIALFYTHQLSTIAMIVAVGFLIALIVINLLGVHGLWPYLLLGVGLWLATYFSGLHSTIAGVMLAFTIPASREIEEQTCAKQVRGLLDRFERETRDEPNKITKDQGHLLHAMEEMLQGVQTPLARVEHAILKPVNFLVMPLFALANAGVTFTGGDDAGFRSHITWGILLGLLIGKPVGVLAATWLMLRSGLGKMPNGSSWSHLFGVAVLCGIGFTMSLFVTNLAYPSNEVFRMDAKIGILAASLLSGILGSLLLRRATRPAKS